jgi:hypothetical protein
MQAFRSDLSFINNSLICLLFVPFATSNIVWKGQCNIVIHAMFEDYLCWIAVATANKLLLGAEYRIYMIYNNMVAGKCWSFPNIVPLINLKSSKSFDI